MTAIQGENPPVTSQGSNAAPTTENGSPSFGSLPPASGVLAAQAPFMTPNLTQVPSHVNVSPNNITQSMTAPAPPATPSQGHPPMLQQQSGFLVSHPGEVKEEEVIDETESVDSNGSRKEAASPRARGSSRGVSLSALIQDKILDPGPETLTIDYLGQKYIGDLLPTGKILWKSMQFASPSAWAIYVKKQVNPSKKSGCGWNSVKYKGKKLDIFKSLYSKKHQSPSTGSTPRQSPQALMDEESNHSMMSSNSGSSSALIVDNRMIRERVPLKHSQLKDMNGEIDPNTLVEYGVFDPNSGKQQQQPFNVAISSNCLLLMDFHCHLTMGEVVGYLGGKWDQERQCLNIVQAFPCKCRLGDRDNAAVSEEQVQLGMQKNGLCKVGWYHSHPTCQAEPTLRDINCQMQYQLKYSTSNPVLALICSPFDTLDASHTESVMNAFWVAPNETAVSPNSCYGIPMKFSFSEVKDTAVSQDLLQELNWLADFYKLAPDLINFTKVWKGNMTYLEKLKLSIFRKLPKDSNSTSLVQFIQKLLTTS